MLGLAGGIAGGVAALRLGEPGEPPVAASPPAGTATPSAPVGLRSTVDRVLPAVVTVLAQLPSERLEDGRVLERQNVGSGVIVSDDGHVITNFHVIEGAAEIAVVLATGEVRPARPLADDSPFTDLAVLVTPQQGLRKLDFGDSGALRAGDPVLAVAGGLLGYDHTVSAGIVSATGRAWPRNGVVLEDLVQTDAAVNHGNSGGALVDIEGRLVGLLTTVVRADASGQAVEGVAFAQSSDSLEPVVSQIIREGEFPRPRIGIERLDQHVEISPELAQERGLPVTQGALVLAPAKGSPARAAGIEEGDIVVAMNGVGVDFDNPLPNLLKRLQPGVDAELVVLRGDRQLLITISPWQE